MNVPQTVAPPDSTALGIRVVYMLLFAVAFWIVCWALGLTALMQLCVRLLNGRPSAEVMRFGHSLGRYAKQVIEFLTFASETLPYPFTAWPAEA
jgi:hypothetical protein